MLHAILKGKARRVNILNEESQSWRSIFRTYEDLLTASLWERISYLSDDALHQFLSSLLEIDVRQWGKFESVIFWPKYDFPAATDESLSFLINGENDYAEPDVVVNFEHAALLVEVKPPAGGKQYQKQWCKEIYTWKNSEDVKPHLHFLALGNLPANTTALFNELNALFNDVSYYGLEWQQFRTKLHYPERAWPSRQDQRIIDDCLQALALYNVRDPLRPWPLFLRFLSSQMLPDDISFLKENYHDRSL